MKKLFLVLIALISLETLAACHTVEGLGEDATAARDAVRDAIDDAR